LKRFGDSSFKDPESIAFQPSTQRLAAVQYAVLFDVKTLRGLKQKAKQPAETVFQKGKTAVGNLDQQTAPVFQSVTQHPDGRLGIPQMLEDIRQADKIKPVLFQNALAEGIVVDSDPQAPGGPLRQKGTRFQPEKLPSILPLQIREQPARVASDVQQAALR
jgi:hypothetical protein